MLNLECFKLGKEGKITHDDFVFLLPKLRRAALKHHHLCERLCNEDNCEPLYNKLIILESKIQKIIKDFSVSANLIIEEIQRDPRGWTIKTNNYWINYLINARR